MSIDIVVRTQVHERAMITRGPAALEPGESALRAEFRLAGRYLVGAAALGRTVTMTVTGLPPHRLPVLLMIATTSVDVAREPAARRRPPGTTSAPTPRTCARLDTTLIPAVS